VEGADRGAGLREVPIDTAIYLVDEAERTYRFLRRNSDWRNLGLEESLRNALGLEGYTRTFAAGARKSSASTQRPRESRGGQLRCVMSSRFPAGDTRLMSVALPCAAITR
jgi:hypothetical protein